MKYVLEITREFTRKREKDKYLDVGFSEEYIPSKEYQHIARVELDEQEVIEFLGVVANRRFRDKK